MGIHILAWLTYIGAICISLYINRSIAGWDGVADVFYSYAPFVISFYLFTFLVFRYYHRRRNFLVAALNGIAIAATICFLQHVAYNLPLHGPANQFKSFDRVIIADTVLNLVQMSLTSFLFFQLQRRVRAERRLRFAEAQKMETEYNYLKSQINPHFLYNTLDYFYAAALKQDKKMAEGIAALAGMMRYSLHTGGAGGETALQEEVEQIEHYIALQQLRFGGALQVKLDVSEIPPHARILPHALITLVENAFKHGVTSDPQYPLTIVLQVHERRILFSVSNRAMPRPAGTGGNGIGLTNLRNRLHLAYPYAHTLAVTQQNDQYTVNLEIESRVNDGHKN